MQDVLMPSLSPEMQSAVIVRWLVQPGERLRKGDALAEIETDKATVELGAEVDGVLLEILSPADGAPVEVGVLIARIEPA